MIYTITFNPALDYVLDVDDLHSADINRAKKEELYAGGKGINVSIILSRLGIKNKALGFLAGFSGKQLKKMLRQEGIKTDFVYLKSGYSRINVKIRSQQEIDINALGPAINNDDIDKLLAKTDNIKSGDYLVLAGSVPSSVPSDIYENIIKALNNKGINFVVDATGDLLTNILEYQPFLIKPNHHELAEIFSVEIKNTDDIIFYGKKLQEMGAKNVLISQGKDGATLIDEYSNIMHTDNVPGKIVDSVGCGDSMVAGFIAGYINAGNYECALKMATACANATAFSNNLADKHEIDHMLLSKHLKIKKINHKE